MPFRSKQKIVFNSFFPAFGKVEVKKREKVFYEDEDLTKKKLPSPSLFSLKAIKESGNLSKLEKVNTIICSSSSAQFEESGEETKTETPTETKTETPTENKADEV